MKKFLIYATVLVVSLFICFTAYYGLQNHERIYMNAENGQDVYLNIGESYRLPIIHEKAYRYTTFDVSGFTNGEVFNFNDEEMSLIAVSGGSSEIVVSPSNENFGPFRFYVYVGDGTDENPFYIRTVSDLKRVGTEEDTSAPSEWTASANYQLCSDLNLIGQNWEPLCTETAFSGKFIGNGHSISNLNIVAGSTHAGLFHTIRNGGTVVGLKVLNANISASINVGIITSRIEDGANIYNCEVNGSISCLGDGYGGGIAGTMYLSNIDLVKPIIQNSTTIVAFSANCNNLSNLGGITGGSIAGNIYNCRAVIGGSVGNMGGIIGVMGTTSAGVVKKGAIVKNSYAFINSASANVGLLAYKVVATAEQTCKIINSYAVNNTGTTTFPYIQINNAQAECIGLDVLTELETKGSNNFNEWNFENIWDTNNNSESAFIKENSPCDPLGEWTYGDTVNTADEIVELLIEMRENPTAVRQYVVDLTEDITIDINESEAATVDGYWTPIGSMETPFRGSFIVTKNDYSLTLNNIKIKSTEDIPYLGFFGVITNGHVENVTFSNVEIEDSNKVVEGGGAVVGNLIFGNIDNCVVNGFTVKNSYYAGGIAGQMYGASIKSCSVTGRGDSDPDITLNHSNKGDLGKSEFRAGGIVSTNPYSSCISDCFVNSVAISIDADFKYTAYIGGLTGINNGRITKSDVSDIVGNNVIDCTIDINSNCKIYAGGVVGQNSEQGDISFVKANTSLIASRTAYHVIIAGIAGINNGKITNCLFSGSVTGCSASGISGINYASGSISSCILQEAMLSGENVGGIVVYNYGDINNTLVGARLEGLSGSSICAGFAVKLAAGSNSLVSHCIADLSLIGQGKFYAESASEFRFAYEANGWQEFWTNVWGDMPETGRLSQCIVLGARDGKNLTIDGSSIVAEVQMLSNKNAGSFIDCTEATALIDANIFTDSGFDFTIWKKESASLPTIIKLAYMFEPVE